MAEVAKDTRIGLVKRIKRFFNDIKTEIKRITWPNRQQTTSGTIAVLVSCVLVGVFIAAVDFILTVVLRFFISR